MVRESILAISTGIRIYLEHFSFNPSNDFGLVLSDGLESTHPMTSLLTESGGLSQQNWNAMVGVGVSNMLVRKVTRLATMTKQLTPSLVETLPTDGTPQLEFLLLIGLRYMLNTTPIVTVLSSVLCERCTPSPQTSNFTRI